MGKQVTFMAALTLLVVLIIAARFRLRAGKTRNRINTDKNPLDFGQFNHYV